MAIKIESKHPQENFFSLKPSPDQVKSTLSLPITSEENEFHKPYDFSS